MAQSKAVLAVLATAVALAGTIDNAELNAGIEALQAETDANGNTQEYKDLKELLETIDAENNAGTDGNGAGGNEEADAKAKAELEAQAKLDAENKAKEEADAKLEAEKNAKKVKPKKYNYAGVRMIGNKWYCDKDKYKKGFSTADECAEHFNG